MKTYDHYINNKFTLSAFGIDRGESKSDYFCTPKGARLIGWTGVDGIHFCTIKSLGETVFAVEPMGYAGRHAFPVAANFDDFLRLLISCGHEAYLEQAHAWSKEDFENFAKENPITSEANQLIACLQNEYGLDPIDEPYDYLKKIYADFDFSTVPYKKDYYEYFPKEEMPLPKEWKVYYSLHERKNGEKSGQELPLNVKFSWAGYEWLVPSAYICAKGSVLDLFAEADSEEVHKFLFKWMFSEDDERFTAEQQLKMETENPLNFDFHSCININGIPRCEQQSCGNVWVQGYEGYQSEAMRDILEHYGLSLDKCWIWRRMCFPWATRSKQNINTLSLKLEQRPHTLIGKKFFVSTAGEKISFIHPVTNKEHTLTVTEYEDDKLSSLHTISDGYEHPAYCTKMAYTIYPDLPNTDFAISDTRQSDAPKKTDKVPKNYDFVSAMSIIGGADGPTSVIMGVPHSEKKIRAACSALTFEPQKNVEWKITFNVKTIDDFNINLKD